MRLLFGGEDTANQIKLTNQPSQVSPFSLTGPALSVTHTMQPAQGHQNKGLLSPHTMQQASVNCSDYTGTELTMALISHFLGPVYFKLAGGLLFQGLEKCSHPCPVPPDQLCKAHGSLPLGCQCHCQMHTVEAGFNLCLQKGPCTHISSFTFLLDCGVG